METFNIKLFILSELCIRIKTKHLHANILFFFSRYGLKTVEQSAVNRLRMVPTKTGPARSKLKVLQCSPLPLHAVVLQLHSLKQVRLPVNRVPVHLPLLLHYLPGQENTVLLHLIAFSCLTHPAACKRLTRLRHTSSIARQSIMLTATYKILPLIRSIILITTAITSLIL